MYPNIIKGEILGINNVPKYYKRRNFMKRVCKILLPKSSNLKLVSARYFLFF